MLCSLHSCVGGKPVIYTNMETNATTRHDSDNNKGGCRLSDWPSCCRKVIATEVAKSGVASAHENLKANAITNAFVARLSSEEFTSAWKKERVFSRLQVRDCHCVV